MNSKRSVIFLLITFSVILPLNFFTSCSEKSPDGWIILTRSAGILKDSNTSTGDSWRYTSQAQIAAINPNKPSGSIKVLTKGYYSACSPVISYDGKFMLFAAQKKQNDHWQIWEMNLATLKTKQITSCNDNCIDPEYLPGGRLIFSKITPNDSLKAGYSLFTCNLDGTNLKRITFNPHTYHASTVLKDGRVLTISKQLFPEKGDPAFMVMRPDGTKAELFYNCGTDKVLMSRARETENGNIVFIEADIDGKEKGAIVSVSYNRPLHTRIELSSGINGEYNDVFPMPSGKLMVSWRTSESARFALYEFDPGKRVPEKSFYNDAAFDVLEAVTVSKHERPKKLPSEVDTGVKTGLLLCQDINVPDPPSGTLPATTAKALRIEVVGIDSSLGIVQTAKDGSFYLKVMADKPFKIRKLDERGNVIDKSCDWIWLRPNERRGCVGCHEDHEQVPDNRIPLAVKNLPVSIPVHIIKVKEKKVSLE